MMIQLLPLPTVRQFRERIIFNDNVFPGLFIIYSIKHSFADSLQSLFVNDAHVILSGMMIISKIITGGIRVMLYNIDHGNFGVSVYKYMIIHDAGAIRIDKIV